MRSGPTYHIRGKIIADLTPVPGHSYSVIAYGADSRNRFRTTNGVAMVVRNRTFDIAGISPGSYTLQLFTPSFVGLGQEDVTVSDADLNDIQMHFMPLASIRGQAVIEGTPPARKPPVSATNGKLSLSEGDFSVAKTCNGVADIQKDNTFSIDNITPGRCNFFAWSLPRTYLKSVRFDDKEVLGKVVDVTPGAHRVTLTFSYNGALIRGKVLNLPSGLVLGSIAVVSETLNEDGSGAHLGLFGASGSFYYPMPLVPGRYRVYAFEQKFLDLSSTFENSAFRKQIESKGTIVDLKENEFKMLEVPLITDNELQQVLAQLPVEP